MRDPDAFLIAQFAKELVASRMKATENPCALAEALVIDLAGSLGGNPAAFSKYSTTLARALTHQPDPARRPALR